MRLWSRARMSNPAARCADEDNRMHVACRKRIRRAGETDGGSEQEEDEGGASTPLPSSSRRRLSQPGASGSDFEPSGDEEEASGSERDSSGDESEGMEYSGMPNHIEAIP